MTQTNFPRNDLSPGTMKWGRAVEAAINAVERAAEVVANRDDNTKSSQSAALALLTTQVAGLTTAQATLARNVATLQAAAQVARATVTPSGGWTGSTGFYNGSDRPSVKISSPTGRIEIKWGGSMNGGNGYLVYSVKNNDSGATIVDRSDVQGDFTQRIAMSGGASFTPSAFNSIVVSVPADTLVVVQLEFYAADAYVYFAGGSIQAGASL